MQASKQVFVITQVHPPIKNMNSRQAILTQRQFMVEFKGNISLQQIQIRTS